jgi:Exopolysaccharide biosynthesis protein YbjH
VRPAVRRHRRAAPRGDSCSISLVAALLATALAFGTGLPGTAGAADEPFTGPSNYGLTGLLETPTARVLPENRFRFGASQVRPYRIYYGTIGLFDRLELNGRITEVIGVPGFDNNAGYGDFKDKSFDAKLQLVKEAKYFPAVSVIISDPTGTRLYASQSIVASKQVYPFDFTLGMGNGRFGKRPLPEQREGFKIELCSNPRSWWRDAGFFGGIQFVPTGWLAVMAEYSSVRYDLQTRDPAQPKYFARAVPSRFNVGVRLQPFHWAELDASWQRGRQFGVNASVAFEIGRPILPIYNPPYREPYEQARNPLHDRIAAALRGTGFSDIGVAGDDFSLRIDAENDRYFFTPSAVEAILDAVGPMLPPRYDYLRIRIKKNGIPVTEFVTTAAALGERRAGSLSRTRFYALSAFRTEHIGEPISPAVDRRRFDWEIGPSFEAFLNDPARFFSYRLGAAASIQTFPWAGGTAVFGIEAYPLNNVTTANSPLSIPVRSDVALYKEQSLSMSRLLFDQVAKTGAGLWARTAAGLLETEYAGADLETALPLFRGRLIADAGGSVVRKRSANEPLRLAGGPWYHTGFLGARLNVPEADLWVDIKAGRFLAGDYGTRITLSKFVRGVTLSAWYTVTDTSIFSDPYNRGYHDKGISVTIPARLFLGRDSRTTYRFSLSPWTRDVGQDIDHFRTLLDFIGRNTDITLDKDTRTLYK